MSCLRIASTEVNKVLMGCDVQLGKVMIFNLKFKLTACVLTVDIPSWFAFGITEKTKLIRADIRDKVSSGPLLLGSEEETSASKIIVPYKPLTGLYGLRPHKKTPLPLFIQQLQLGAQKLILISQIWAQRMHLCFLSLHANLEKRKMWRI